MDTSFKQLKLRFKQKDILIQLILINVAVFFLLFIMGIVSKLFKLESIDILVYLGVSSDVLFLAWHPWTIFTYMFVHQDVLHILFNMLLLYWFGQMFLSSFNAKQLGSLYILGGLAGAILYIITFNFIPYYVDMGHPLMIGASASVMAIIFGIAFYRPNTELRLVLIGNIKIVYIALFFFVVDFIALGSESNPGGHVAHIGGAVLGYIFAKQYLIGTDITRWMTKMIDGVANLGKKRPKKKMKVTYKKREQDYEYNKRKKEEVVQIDIILDKIKESGYSSLSSDEKKRLFDASKK